MGERSAADDMAGGVEPQLARGWRRVSLLLLVIAVGALVALQPALNAELGKSVGEATASVVSFGTGFLVLVLVAGFAGQLGGVAQVTEVRWPYLLGGVLGAAVVLVSLAAIPKLGAGPLTAALVFGQLIMAVIVDRQGWLGVPQADLTAPRIAGVVLLLAGVVLVTRK
ncbi:MAG: DMT family transporter [Patulibacter minatonensis]